MNHDNICFCLLAIRFHLLFERHSHRNEIHDLEKMGLIKIFDEVLREKTFNYPVFFNFEDSYFTINGYSINKDVATEYKTSLTNYQANQPYFDVFNNFFFFDVRR